MKSLSPREELEQYVSDKKAEEFFKNAVLGDPESSTQDLRISLLTPQVIASKNQIRRVQPPLGIGCLAAVLEEYGFNKLQVLDASALGYNEVIEMGDGFVKFGSDPEKIADQVAAFNADVVGISALFSSQVECAFELARSIRKILPKALIVFGGIHASKMAEPILKEHSEIDYIICGEADLTFTLFCQKVLASSDVYSIPGLAWRNKDSDGVDVVEINRQLPGLNMNELPVPAWHQIDMKMYYDIGMPHNPFLRSREFLTIMTERGCPEKCYFCTSASFFGNSGRFRALTPENTYSMIASAVEKYGVKELQIEDDTFTLNAQRVIDICRLLEPLKLRITLPNAIRADAPKNKRKRLHMFKAMRAAGFAKIGISAEHGDQEFLDKVVGKRLDLTEVEASVHLAHEAGLMVHTNFMMGFPFETVEHREKTMQFARSLKSDSFSVSLAAPLPGTPLWNVCAKHNLFMPGFDINRLVYDVVNIRPHDISPEALRELVVAFNAELNASARNRSAAAKEHYTLFEGNNKDASNDRKYSYVSSEETFGSVTPS
ncbi:radical SAM protein [Gammaproteobacteria bacterium]|nr:radical SAM protein [Gammaproteobacteria bacterium]